MQQDELYRDENFISLCCGDPMSKDIDICPCCNDHTICIEFNEQNDEEENQKIFEAAFL